MAPTAPRPSGFDDESQDVIESQVKVEKEKNDDEEEGEKKDRPITMQDNELPKNIVLESAKVNSLFCEYFLSLFQKDPRDGFSGDIEQLRKCDERRSQREQQRVFGRRNNRRGHHYRQFVVGKKRQHFECGICAFGVSCCVGWSGWRRRKQK